MFFCPRLHNPVLARLDDQAIVNVNGTRLAFTTDSFVVKPLFFPGGDIGSLAVHGTINDLAMGGATPLFLSAAFIIEEGFPMEDLRRVVSSMRAGRGSGGRASGDRRYESGGKRQRRRAVYQYHRNRNRPGRFDLSADRARPGDKVLLSGSIGEHGIAILAQREGLEFESPIAERQRRPAHAGSRDASQPRGEIRCMRDPTRGGLSSALNEIAAQSHVGIELEEIAIPVREKSRRVRVAGARPAVCGE